MLVDFIQIAAPECWLLCATTLILLLVAVLKKPGNLIYLAAQFALAGAFVLTWQHLSQPKLIGLSGNFIDDQLARILKLFIYVIVAAIFMYSRNYLKSRNIAQGEFLVLSLFSTLGMLILVSAHSLLVIYLGLELLSLPIYALIAMQRDSYLPIEAAMKYFVLGALASGILLYGISILYGISGALDLSQVAAAVNTQLTQQPILVSLALIFVLIGVAFKFGAVPFHMWLPDVYEGSPTPQTMLIATAPKLSAFAMFIRLLQEGLGAAHGKWIILVMLLAVLSVGLGNLVAVAQTNFKRLLAYSAIGHVGFIFLALLGGSNESYAAALYYVITYVLMTAAAFGFILVFAREDFEADKLSDYRGLSERAPFLALMMMFIMFSMAGIPPFVGFFAKMNVLEILLQQNHPYLALLAVLFSVIGAYYYLRIVWLMYFEKPEHAGIIKSKLGSKVVLGVNSIGLLGLGLGTQVLFNLCYQVFF